MVCPIWNTDGQKVTDDCSNSPAVSREKPIKVENDRDKEFFDCIFQKLLKENIIHQDWRFSDKSLSKVERNR